MSSVNKFLSGSEQRTYDQIVDGLRRRGWSKSEAEAEAIARVDAMRPNQRFLGFGTITYTDKDGKEVTTEGTFTVVKP